MRLIYVRKKTDQRVRRDGNLRLLPEYPPDVDGRELPKDGRCGGLCAKRFEPKEGS